MIGVVRFDDPLPKCVLILPAKYQVSVENSKEGPSIVYNSSATSDVASSLSEPRSCGKLHGASFGLHRDHARWMVRRPESLGALGVSSSESCRGRVAEAREEDRGALVPAKYHHYTSNGLVRRYT